MKIHFIGIGRIGVSALAQYYLAKGLVSSETTNYPTFSTIVENVCQNF